MVCIAPIRAYIKRHRLSQREFGELAGVSQGMVWQWLKGQRPISAESAVAIERGTAGEIKRHQILPRIFAE